MFQLPFLTYFFPSSATCHYCSVIFSVSSGNTFYGYNLYIILFQFQLIFLERKIISIFSELWPTYHIGPTPRMSLAAG